MKRHEAFWHENYSCRGLQHLTVCPFIVIVLFSTAEKWIQNTFVSFTVVNVRLRVLNDMKEYWISVIVMGVEIVPVQPSEKLNIDLWSMPTAKNKHGLL